jgi:DNA-binding SARP family transcriptional activator
MVTASQRTSPARRERRSSRPREGSARGRPAAELRLLDAFDLLLDGEPVALPLPAQRVLAFLALNDRPVLRAAVAGRLWLDCTEPHALGSLRSALWRLRQPGARLVETANGRLELGGDLSVDVRVLLQWSRRQLDSLPTSDEEDVEHVRLSGELLPDWYDDWVVLERERLREVHVRALEALCDRLTSSGSYHRAGEAALAAIKGDPLRESAHRCLIRVHLAEGNDAEAVRCYRLFQKLLLDELGLQPSSKMGALVAGVMAQ